MPEVAQFPCFECPRIEKKCGDRRRHMNQAHHKPMSYCWHCGEDQNTAQSLQKHIFVEHGKKYPLFCMMCNKIYQSWTSINHHLHQSHQILPDKFEQFVNIDADLSQLSKPRARSKPRRKILSQDQRPEEVSSPFEGESNENLDPNGLSHNGISVHGSGCYNENMSLSLDVTTCQADCQQDLCLEYAELNPQVGCISERPSRKLKRIKHSNNFKRDDNFKKETMPLSSNNITFKPRNCRQIIVNNSRFGLSDEAYLEGKCPIKMFAMTVEDEVLPFSRAQLMKNK